MSLEQQIQSDIKAAMIAKDKVRLESLRSVKAAILIEKTSGSADEITDEKILKIIQKLVKQRRESAEIFKQQSREELAANELLESSFLEVYLPKALTEEELTVAIKAIIVEVGASAPSDMGKVMGVATKSLSGKADGRAISAMVKSLLS